MPAEPSLELITKPAQGEHADGPLELDEQIDVTLRTCLVPRYRPEQQQASDVHRAKVRLVLSKDPEGVIASHDEQRYRRRMGVSGGAKATLVRFCLGQTGLPGRHAFEGALEIISRDSGKGQGTASGGGDPARRLLVGAFSFRRPDSERSKPSGDAALKAHVKNGRLVLDEPTDLPEGEVVELVPLDEMLANGGDYLDDEERERLHEALEISVKQAKKGKLIDADEVMATGRVCETPSARSL